MALSGAPYALPMLQYELELSRILSACPQQVKITGDAADGVFWRDELAFELSATAKPTHIAGERYLVDYSKLDGWLKTTNFAIEYQPGTDILKGINVSIADQSGDVTANIVKAGLTVAAVASGAPGAAPLLMAIDTPSGTTMEKREFLRLLTRGNTKGIVPDIELLSEIRTEQLNVRDRLVQLVSQNAPSKTIIMCQTSVMEDITARKQIAAQIKTDSENLKIENAALERRTKIAQVGGLNANGRTELGANLGRVIDLETAVQAGQTKLAEIEKRLGIAGNAVWPTSFAEHRIDTLAPVSNADAVKLANLLKTGTVRVIDEGKLASSLASHPDLQLFRLIAKEFVDHYVDSDGNPKDFTKPAAPPSCTNSGAGAPDIDGCVSSLTKLAAELTPVVSDGLPLCSDAQIELRKEGKPVECLFSLANDKHTTSAHFPRQVHARGVNPQKGLFVRPPVRAQIRICQAAFDAAADGGIICASGAKNLVKDDKVLAPQLGQLRFFELENEMFSNDALSLSLSKDGAIDKFQYGSSKNIAKSVADAAVQGAEFAKKRSDEFAANTDPKAIADKKIALKEAQDKLENLYADPTPDPMKAIAISKALAEVELLRAQINTLNAQLLARSGT
jgi:hypothetical protein